jgi:uncharacterized protein (DUF433 family)
MSAVSLTANEVAALVGLDESQVRKDVEHGLIGAGSPPRFSLADAVYFAILAALGLQLGVQDRKKLHDLIASAMSRTKPPPRVELSPVLDVKVAPVAEVVGERLTRFEAWKEKLVTDDKILGGEPVFPKSRLAVRNVGALLLKGAPREELREDYPYLNEQDLEFAKIYTLAYPRMGRPREHQAPPR